MPEKVRPISPQRKFSFKRGFLVLVVVFLFAAVVFGISQLFEKFQQGPNQIKDKTTAAIVCATNECFAMNRQGIVYTSIAQPGGNLLFRIDTEPETIKVVLGKKVMSEDTLAELMFLREQLNKELGIPITHAKAMNEELTHFDFFTREGWAIKINTENNAPAEIEILRRTLGEIGEQRTTLDYIDLRIPTRVYVKQK